jgi:hypothetical protein
VKIIKNNGIYVKMKKEVKLTKLSKEKMKVIKGKANYPMSACGCFTCGECDAISMRGHDNTGRIQGAQKLVAIQ